MFWLEGVITTPYSYEPFLLYTVSFFIFSGLCIQTSVTIYDPLESPPGEVCDVSYVRLYCTGNLYRTQEVKFSFKKKKKQIPNELLCGARLESVSQWRGMWICVEIAINMKFCNMNDVLYDKWNTS